MQRPWTFTVVCPQGHYVAQEGFDQETLRALLKTSRPLRLYCAHCERYWQADSLQRGNIAWALDQGS